MHKIVVLSLSEDYPITEKLVPLLAQLATTWWCKQIIHGNWETQVREKINDSTIVVPIFSAHYQGKRQDILQGEIAYAHKVDKHIIPFCIEKTHLPFSIESYDRVEAYGWGGESDALPVVNLKEKIGQILSIASEPPRKQFFKVGNGQIQLPSFVFSLSSHETQVTPEDGIKLLTFLDAKATLISAYDIHKKELFEHDSGLVKSINNLRENLSIIYLDSGNYEASRKSDYASPTNPNGWKKESYWKVANHIHADVIFAYDKFEPSKSIKTAATNVCRNYLDDSTHITIRDSILCPIIHIPKGKQLDGIAGKFGGSVALKVADKIQPQMIAFAERELGDGILTRMRNLHLIRDALNKRGEYLPIHILGTGNPLSIALLAVAGGDSFDGLEWCRTSSDFSGRLFHFQFFQQFMKQSYNDSNVAAIMNRSNFTMKAVTHNFYATSQWVTSIQSLIHTKNEDEIFTKVNASLGVDFDWKLFRANTK